MIQKLRRKFVAVVMGAAAVILLVVFAVLVVSTGSGMGRQTSERLEAALNAGMAPGEGRFENGNKTGEPPDNKAFSENPKKPGGFNQRFSCFTVLAKEDGTVTLEDHAAILFSDLGTEEIEELARTAAARPEDSGSLPAYRLSYAKRETPEGVLIAFADTSAEYGGLMELIKNSLIVGALTLLVVFGASVLLARWAVRPVEQAWNQQKQFVGDASHELKTPLTVILSNADMLLAHPNDGNTRWAENIKAEAQRMKALTQELLSLARSDDETRRPVMETVDLSYLVTDSVLSFEPAVFESGHELSYDVAPGLSLLGDAAGLSQLCGILLDNALKYASPGGAVRVKLEAAGKSVRLSVSNEGDPIPQQDLARIFERFYRADPSRHGEGHGLGLAIARRVAELHKGKIWAESGEGVNTFIVTLPCGKAVKN